MAGHRDRPAGQLTLALDRPDPGALPARVTAMVPDAGPRPFDDEAYFFEPWWPGARAFAFLEGGWLRLQTEHLADPLDAFPELLAIGRQVRGDGVLLDGTLLVLDDEGRPDRELLHRRLAEPAITDGVGAFVASDLLWVDGSDITARPFEERHRRLAAILSDSDRCMASRGIRGEGHTLATAVASMGIDAVSARRLAAPWRSGAGGGDWLKVPVEEQPAAETRPLLVLLQRLPLDA